MFILFSVTAKLVVMTAGCLIVAAPVVAVFDAFDEPGPWDLY